MIIHLCQILWSLRVLWSTKGIVWPPDRVRLWIKSINLYLSFLALTDPERPEGQLRRAMICALLSAVYDYDSDWMQGKRDGVNCLSLLHRYVESQEAKTIAVKLFSGDVAQNLSEDGLERGSGALRFYWLVINSQWMRKYTQEEIDLFGRRLQIVDDLLDLERDFLSGDTNCLLTIQAQSFANEARAFLVSDFYKQLMGNSRVYRVIAKKAGKALNRFGSAQVTFWQLFGTGRPATAGAFGLLLPIASFGFYTENVSWLLIIAVALGFACLTMSIMVFNDWKDREHDRKKGKLFASENPKEMWAYWKNLSWVTAGLLLLVAWYSLPLASFCCGVWLIGVLYSFVPHWFIVQNVIVAVCSGAPSLCGAVYHRQLNLESVLTFLLFVSLVFIAEIYKDIEDARIDDGYKLTIPVKIGHVSTVGLLIGLIFVPALIMTQHPNAWVVPIAMVGLPLLAFSQGVALLRRENILRAKWAMRQLLSALLAAFLVS